LDPALFRDAREAKASNWSDEYAATIFDRRDALERDGFHGIEDAPEEWLWAPGGRS